MPGPLGCRYRQESQFAASNKEDKLQLLVMGDGSMLWLAGVASLVLALVFGAVPIPWLRHHKFGQPIRAAGPESHKAKQGTPTMGGFIFVLPGFAVALAVDPRNLSIGALAFLTMSFMAIGFMDDYVKVGKKRSLGLKARQKLAAQVIVSGLFAWFAARYLGAAGPWALPWGGMIQPGLWYYPVTIFAVLATGNTVNLADGLDGLAGGTSFLAIAFFVVYAIKLGQTGASVAALALAAALVGFLRYNLKPARVIMGDTGSLALGGARARGTGDSDPVGPRVAHCRRGLCGRGLVRYHPGHQLPAHPSPRLPDGASASSL